MHYSEAGTWGPLEVPDSFVVKKNKIGSGSGEAKYYIGGREDEALRAFFGAKLFLASCVMFKNDLLTFMDAVYDEYHAPSQNYLYKSELPGLWSQRQENVSSLPEEIFFQVREQKAGGHDRCYIKGSGSYELLRELPLPRNAYVVFTKLVSKDGSILQWVRLVPRNGDSSAIEREDIELSLVRMLENDKDLDDYTRLQVIKARVGQGRYRSDLLGSCGSFCPMTGIDDVDLLVASHIKPWRDANNEERLDSQNGFIFSPLWDKLFDRGFISFDDQGRLLISSKLSTRTARLMGLVPGTLCRKLPIHGIENAKRLQYLKYHQTNVFQL